MYIEAFKELKKVFHAGGNCIRASMGMHTATKYNALTFDGASGSNIIGRDWSFFQVHLDR